MIRWAEHIALWMLVVAFAKISFAQEVQVTMAMDTQKILLGQPVQMTFELQAPAGDTVVWPAWKDTLIKSVEILSKGKIDTSFEGNNMGTRVMQQALTVTSFDSGYYPIPPVDFVVGGDVYSTDVELLEVHTVAVDSTGSPKDIKEPIDVRYTWMDWLKDNWLPIAGGFVLVSFLTAVLIFLLRRKPVTVAAKAPVIPQRPAHEIALERLAELESKKLWQNDQAKAYHTELSVILREYLEARFRIRALEQTSEEIIASFNQLSISSDSRNSLRNYFKLADLVKFAKSKPLGSENELSLQQVRDFVNQTTPKPTNSEG
ncbi:MAG: hypothetical protein ACFB10_22565 [Salibacteraceae bacterium]|mgnify:CR=1 FL=1